MSGAPPRGGLLIGVVLMVLVVVLVVLVVVLVALVVVLWGELETSDFEAG